MDGVCPRTCPFILCVWFCQAPGMDPERGWEVCRSIPRLLGVWICLRWGHGEWVDGFRGYFTRNSRSAAGRCVNEEKSSRSDIYALDGFNPELYALSCMYFNSVARTVTTKVIVNQWRLTCWAISILGFFPIDTRTKANQRSHSTLAERDLSLQPSI